MLDGMYVTKSISTGLYPNLDLWTANKLQLLNWESQPHINCYDKIGIGRGFDSSIYICIMFHCSIHIRGVSLIAPRRYTAKFNYSTLDMQHYFVSPNVSVRSRLLN